MNKIPLDQIVIYPEQRQTNPDHVRYLAQKIKERGYNYSYPVTLDDANGLVDGGHRVEAARLAGLEEVPFVVREANGMTNIQYRIWCNECGPGFKEDDPTRRFDGVPAIYFIQGSNNGLIKIGFTQRIKRRLMELQVGSPIPLKIIGLISGDKNLEEEVHQKFITYHQYGEWFNPSPKILEYIKAHPEGILL